MRLNHWVSAASLCSPSRASLMTGRLAVRTGVYPGVFYADARDGLPLNETTVAEALRGAGYATAAVGKWHLGQRAPYLPTARGFDSWTGLPGSADQGSVPGNVCGWDVNNTENLPLFLDDNIVQQPVNLSGLAAHYANFAAAFIKGAVEAARPFFLYIPFSHVHQLCYPKRRQWCGPRFQNASAGGKLGDAVQEADWITGQVLAALAAAGVEDSTLVLWVSDDGPWTAEQANAGSPGPFVGRWLADNSDANCTVCPNGYANAPTPAAPRRCVYDDDGGESMSLTGIPCGADVGLGSTWEANLRMPALARWPGVVPAGSSSLELVSSTDFFATALHLAGVSPPPGIVLDGVNMLPVLQGGAGGHRDGYVFHWRNDDSASGSVRPVLYAVRAGAGGWKLHLRTKSATGGDAAVVHPRGLLFDVLADPAEAFPIAEAAAPAGLVDSMLAAAAEHVAGVRWTGPACLAHDPRYFPCCNVSTACRCSTGESVDD